MDHKWKALKNNYPKVDGLSYKIGRQWENVDCSKRKWTVSDLLSQLFHIVQYDISTRSSPFSVKSCQNVNTRWFKISENFKNLSIHQNAPFFQKTKLTKQTWYLFISLNRLLNRGLPDHRTQVDRSDIFTTRLKTVYSWLISFTSSSSSIKSSFSRRKFSISASRSSSSWRSSVIRTSVRSNFSLF